MRYVCPDCHVYLKVHVVGVQLLETMGFSTRMPYKLYMADLMICEVCGHRLVVPNDKPFAQHFEDGFALKIKAARESGQLFYADERPGRKAKP